VVVGHDFIGKVDGVLGDGWWMIWMRVVEGMAHHIVVTNM
jgi:hypothetical protein